MQKKNIPTVFVIFGATGDLIEKKIIPALFHLYKKNKLPQMLRIIGFSRRKISEQDFRDHVRRVLKNEKDQESFIQHFFYQQGDFHHAKNYKELANMLGRVDDEWKVCSNKLFYLAVPPRYYKTIFNHLASSGLTIPCGPDEGWTRVIVEKPFGRDLKTAEELDLLLAKLFKEEQIYRIDHYLAKEMLQNIVSFRFSNNLLEQSWNNKNIEKIEIRLLEKIGVEKRGYFYDGVGALRDVGQNHLLQMLALVTMDTPTILNSEQVRPLRARVLSKLIIPTPSKVAAETFRAQHEGYRSINGVAKYSQTETYFKIKAYLDSARWQGVPITMESGKRMKKQVKEIVVTFKHITPCLCPPGRHYKNKVIFQLEPEERIQISFLSKKPGLDSEIEDRNLEFMYRSVTGRTQYVEEYEKLLLDCIEGNQLLFVSTDEIKAMWNYVDPIIQGWKKNTVPLSQYHPETDQILGAADDHFEKNKKELTIKKELAVIGLGKMGANFAKNCLDRGWRVIGYNRTTDDTKVLEKRGLTGIYNLLALKNHLVRPRIIWLMLPAGEVVDTILFGKDGLTSFLDRGDIIIDAGNSYYKDSQIRAKKIKKLGFNYVDVGFSGGPSGARRGACFMVGGEKKLYDYLLPLFVATAAPQGVSFFEGYGAGHFVKMIHNGIEYGMMQALAEGFHILKKSSYKLDLTKVASVYNHGSVIESRLVGWLKNAFDVHGTDLKGIGGTVGHTGEGMWTIQTAKEMKIKAKVIEDALQFRIYSQKNPDYAGQVLSALRNQFGGHSAK